MQRCNEYKFFMTQDAGYSNYTVIETEVSCIKDANPYFPCEESYSWTKEGAPDYAQLQIAETCPHYKKGEGMSFDVDGEVTLDDYKDDPDFIPYIMALRLKGEYKPEGS